MLYMLADGFRAALYQYSYQALLLILILSGPPIAIASIIGLLVAIFQSATQIQEQTFSFAVKMVAVMATVLLMGGWLGGLILNFGMKIFTNFYRWN